MTNHRNAALALATDENSPIVHALIHIADTIADTRQQPDETRQPAASLCTSYIQRANVDEPPAHCVRPNGHVGPHQTASGYAYPNAQDRYAYDQDRFGVLATQPGTQHSLNPADAEQFRLHQYGKFVADIADGTDDIAQVIIDGVIIARTVDTTAGLTDEQMHAIRAMRSYAAALRAGKVNMAPDNPMHTAKLVETVLVLAGAWRVR